MLMRPQNLINLFTTSSMFSWKFNFLSRWPPKYYLQDVFWSNLADPILFSSYLPRPRHIASHMARWVVNLFDKNQSQKNFISDESKHWVPLRDWISAVSSANIVISALSDTSGRSLMYIKKGMGPGNNIVEPPY